MSEAINNECQALILERLAKAGAKGLSKSGLKLPAKASNKGKLCHQVLLQLEKVGQIGNLGSKTKSCYVLAEFYKPLEIAYQHVLNQASEAGNKLCSKAMLGKGLRGVAGKKLDEALRLLVSEGELIKLRWSSYAVYLHRSALPLTATEVIKPLDPSQVIQAYKDTVTVFSYADVKIHEIYLRLNAVNLDTYKSFLVEACEQGKAIATVGDWSLASEEERKSAIYLNGKAHLRIRLQE